MAEKGLCVVLQWDGQTDSVYKVLRGKELLEKKQRAFENLKKAGARLGLCPTVVAGVNDQELGGIYGLFMSDDAIGTLDIATMAYVGKGSRFEKGKSCRITAQDVLTCLEAQTDRRIRESDFSPVSFSRPECLQIAYLLAHPNGDFFPLKRFLDPEDYQALIMNKPLLVLNSDVEDAFNDVVNRLWGQARRKPGHIYRPGGRPLRNRYSVPKNGPTLSCRTEIAQHAFGQSRSGAFLHGRIELRYRACQDVHQSYCSTRWTADAHMRL